MICWGRSDRDWIECVRPLPPKVEVVYADNGGGFIEDRIYIPSSGSLQYKLNMSDQMILPAGLFKERVAI